MARKRGMLSLRVTWGGVARFCMLPVNVGFDSLVAEVSRRFGLDRGTPLPPLSWREAGETFELKSREGWEECLQRRGLVAQPGRLELCVESRDPPPMPSHARAAAHRHAQAAHALHNASLWALGGVGTTATLRTPGGGGSADVGVPVAVPPFPLTHRAELFTWHVEPLNCTRRTNRQRTAYAAASQARQHQLQHLLQQQQATSHGSHAPRARSSSRSCDVSLGTARATALAALGGRQFSQGDSPEGGSSALDTAIRPVPSLGGVTDEEDDAAIRLQRLFRDKRDKRRALSSSSRPLEGVTPSPSNAGAVAAAGMVAGAGGSLTMSGTRALGIRRSSSRGPLPLHMAAVDHAQSRWGFGGGHDGGGATTVSAPSKGQPAVGCRQARFRPPAAASVGVDNAREKGLTSPHGLQPRQAAPSCGTTGGPATAAGGMLLGGLAINGSAATLATHTSLRGRRANGCG